MLSNTHIRVRLVTLLFFWMIIGNVLAQSRTNVSGKENDPKLNSRFSLGFYTGINDPFNSVGKASDIGPSFMIYGSYKLSDKWYVEVGFGGVFYFGKSLGYMHSKNVFDTVYAKSYTVTGAAYTVVPVIFKYQVTKKIQLQAGVRWLGVSGIFGTGTYGIYSPNHKDSFMFKSNLIPGLPKGANFEDVQGLVGLELALSRHFSMSLRVDVGFIPIYPANLTDINSHLTGNYNEAISFGLNYNVTP